MIQYHEDEMYDLAASPIYALNRHVVGREGLEPPVSNESGFTVRAATNYRLPPQMSIPKLFLEEKKIVDRLLCHSNISALSAYDFCF